MNDEWFEKEQLHFAAQDGDLRKVKDLVEKGYPVNSFDELDKTPLHYAAEGEHLNIVKFLIESGADVNAHNENNAGNSPLREVAAGCSYEMAEVLIRSGADPTIPGWMQITALDKASKRKNAEGKRIYQFFKKAAEQRSK